MREEKRFIGNNASLKEISRLTQGKITRKIERKIAHILQGVSNSGKINILQVKNNAIDFSYSNNGNAFLFQIIFIGTIFVLYANNALCEAMASAIASL